MVELMKPLLHGNHDKHSTTKCFFAVSCKNVVKNYLISNASIFNFYNLGQNRWDIFVCIFQSCQKFHIQELTCKTLLV